MTDAIMSILDRDPRAAKAAFLRASAAVNHALSSKNFSRFWASMAENELQEIAAKAPPRKVGHFATAEETTAILQHGVEMIRVCAEVEAALLWVDSLKPHEKHLMENAPQGPERIKIARELGQRNSTIAEWIERGDARALRIDAANASSQAASEAAWRATAPQRALAAIEATGAVLSLRKGAEEEVVIVAESVNGITAGLREALSDNKAEVVAILAARALASRPVVLA